MGKFYEEVLLKETHSKNNIRAIVISKRGIGARFYCGKRRLYKFILEPTHIRGVDFIKDIIPDKVSASYLAIEEVIILGSTLDECNILFEQFRQSRLYNVLLNPEKKYRFNAIVYTTLNETQLDTLMLSIKPYQLIRDILQPHHIKLLHNQDWWRSNDYNRDSITPEVLGVFNGVQAYYLEREKKKLEADKKETRINKATDASLENLENYLEVIRELLKWDTLIRTKYTPFDFKLNTSIPRVPLKRIDGLPYRKNIFTDEVYPKTTENIAYNKNIVDSYQSLIYKLSIYVYDYLVQLNTSDKLSAKVILNEMKKQPVFALGTYIDMYSNLGFKKISSKKEDFYSFVTKLLEV